MDVKLDGVCRIGDAAQKSYERTHLWLGEEVGRRARPHWHAAQIERSHERLDLRVAPREDRDVTWRNSSGDARGDARGHAISFSICRGERFDTHWRRLARLAGRNLGGVELGDVWPWPVVDQSLGCTDD